MSKTSKLAVTLLVLLVLPGLITSPPIAKAYTSQKIAEYVKTPLPSAPTPVLVGGAFPVRVRDLSDSISVEDASAWSGSISSIYGAYSVSLVNGTRKGDDWLLYFRIPADVHPGLYNLTLTQRSASESQEIHQSRSIWVLDEWPESITISHITDIHEPIGELVFPAYILQSNFMDPDLVFATGDIVHTESNARAWKYLQYAMLHMLIPSYLLPGNHDYSGYGGKAYSLYGGRLNYTLVLGNFVFIALDTGETGYLEADQLKWLETQLEKHSDKVKIIGFHHSFLSNEFEEDLGAMKGGYIEADWENINEISDIMYFTWKDDEGTPLSASRTLLRLIEEYDVRVILNGHVHRDMIYVVNNRHYFITTSTTGGGLPPNQRYGSRLITVDHDGTVHLDKYAAESLDNPPNNIPTGSLRYWYMSANDFSETSITAVVENNLNMSIKGGRLVFKASNAVPIETYTFKGITPTNVETTPTERGYVFDAYFDVEPYTSFSVTLTAAEDNESPKVWVEPGDPISPDSSMAISVIASDEGWGVKSVNISYSMDNGETWTSVDAEIGPILTGECFDITISEPTIAFEVPPLDDAGLVVRVDVSDYAQNKESYIFTEWTSGGENYTLKVESEPIPVMVSVNGVSKSTPYNESLPAGEYTLTVPGSVISGGEEYVFQGWSTGDNSPETSINLDSDMSLSVVYQKQAKDATPGGGVPLAAVHVLAGILLAMIYFGRRRSRAQPLPV